jgi:hypothetical protein
MLTLLDKRFNIDPIIEQVKSLGSFKRFELNNCTGEFFNDPWLTKAEFKNTPLGDVLDSLENIGQARLLSLDAGESYTAHCDPDDRIHLPIITNPHAYLVNISDNNLHHIPATGEIWHMDTSKVHVAANWGSRTRVHLNIRVLLPRYNSLNTGIRIKVLDGDYDWKQLAYTPIMCIINTAVKNKEITGFKGLSEKEILVNTTVPSIFDKAFESIKQCGIDLEVEQL